jgi:hypothetical protein
MRLRTALSLLALALLVACFEPESKVEQQAKLQQPNMQTDSEALKEESEATNRVADHDTVQAE